MDFFKQRARQILIEEVNPEDFQYEYEQEFVDEMAYDGKPLPLKLCYQQLKNILRRPLPNVGKASETVPGYMKMTFATSRTVAANSKLLELSGMLSSIKQLKNPTENLLAIKNGMTEMTLLKSMKPEKIKTKKEQEIDDKIEKLLYAYKKQDEEAARRAKNLEKDRKQGKKNLMAKFGFSDDEEDEGGEKKQSLKALLS